MGEAIPAELQRALDAVAQTERIDQLPQPPGAPDDGQQAVDAIVQRAGPRAIPELERLAREAGPTGRVRAVILLLTIAPERALPHLARMRDDDAPIVVNTCLVGYRRTSDWARSLPGGAPRVAPAPSASRAPLVLLALLALAVLAAFLLWRLGVA